MFVMCVVCCQVEVSATSWSLIQRSPTDCGALCVIKKPRGRGGHSPRWAAEPEIIIKKYIHNTVIQRMGLCSWHCLYLNLHSPSFFCSLDRCLVVVCLGGKVRCCYRRVKRWRTTVSRERKSEQDNGRC
jgi:hypothetical protein